MSRAWDVTERSASAVVLHAELPEPGRRQIRVATPTGPALVLGSAQDPAMVDTRALAARHGEIVRRRTGGGAVWVMPDDPLWLDVTVPANDPLHHDDVVRSFAWLGECWVAALAEVGLTGVAHDGPADRDALARLACFAGRGPGEVSVGGSKVVGISQRRGRAGAIFQCAVNRELDPQPLLDVLGRGADPDLAAALPRRGTGVAHPRLLDAFLTTLP